MRRQQHRSLRRREPAGLRHLQCTLHWCIHAMRVADTAHVCAAVVRVP